MRVVQLQEQLLENTCLQQTECGAIIPYMDDSSEVARGVKRGHGEKELCLKLSRKADGICATGSYSVGVDWIKEEGLATQVSLKMNDGFEIDYICMSDEALAEPDNMEHLRDLPTIRFDRPSTCISQKQDLLSIFLIIEYLNTLRRTARKGLKKSCYRVEENLSNKVKGHIPASRMIRRGLVKGRITDDACRYQVYDIDLPENRILKKVLTLCKKQLEVYKHALDTKALGKKIGYVQSSSERVGDEISVKAVKILRRNPAFKEYFTTTEYTQLLLRRFSYDITLAGKSQIVMPPFWIDTSRLLELYVSGKLKKTLIGKREIQYHMKAYYWEFDHLLRPTERTEPYIIGAKYKPCYKQGGGITIDDAREVSSHARLNKIYKELGLNEETALPIKCLIIYPDQDREEQFTFTKTEEPVFKKVSGYVRFYELGVRLPIVQTWSL